MRSTGAGCAATTATPGTNAPTSSPTWVSRWLWDACPRPACKARVKALYSPPATAELRGPHDVALACSCYIGRHSRPGRGESPRRFPQHSMASRKTIIAAVAAVVVMAAGAAIWRSSSQAPSPAGDGQAGSAMRGASAGAGPATLVTVAAAQTQDIPVEVTVSGNVMSLNSV